MVRTACALALRVFLPIDAANLGVIAPAWQRSAAASRSSRQMTPSARSTRLDRQPAPCSHTSNVHSSPSSGHRREHSRLAGVVDVVVGMTVGTDVVGAEASVLD